MRENTRILVIGAGVNGSYCTVRLWKAGVDVTVLARGQRYNEIHENGIIIDDPIKKERTVTRVLVIQSLAPDDVYDYIFVVVRKNQVADLLPVLAANRSPNIVFMVNNPSGPDEFVKALGKERVMLGFVFGAGRREGNVIHAIGGFGGHMMATPFGEIDGTITPRLTRLVDILSSAGLNAKVNTEISDYLATHAAMVAPFAAILIKHNCNNYELAQDRTNLKQLVDSIRETLDVLQANGIKITPKNENTVKILPRFILVLFLHFFLNTKFAEYGAAWHCTQAPDEMEQLGRELMVLVENSGLPAPALRKVLAY